MREVRFPSGGLSLHGVFHAAPGRRKGAVVLVHGFNSSLEEYGHLPAWLARAGYDCLAFDQAGFGQSEGERGRTDVDRASRDIAAALQQLRELAGPDIPLGLVGHSLGGAYGAHALGPGTPVRAAVLAHPVDSIWHELVAPARGMYHVLGRRAERRLAQGLDPGRIPYKSSSRKLFVSLEAAREAGRPDFLQRYVNLANYRAAYTMDGAGWARAATVPTLVVVSPHDKVVRPKHSLRVYDSLPEPKALLEHEGGHSCFRDLDGRFVADGIIAWFDRHLQGA